MVMAEASKGSRSKWMVVIKAYYAKAGADCYLSSGLHARYVILYIYSKTEKSLKRLHHVMFASVAIGTGRRRVLKQLW